MDDDDATVTVVEDEDSYVKGYDTKAVSLESKKIVAETESLGDVQPKPSSKINPETDTVQKLVKKLSHNIFQKATQPKRKLFKCLVHHSPQIRKLLSSK